MGAIYFELLGNLFCSVTFLVLLPPPPLRPEHIRLYEKAKRINEGWVSMWDNLPHGFPNS